MIASCRLKSAKASKTAIKRLQKNGCQAYWVGGSVRDLILKKKPKDFDVVTSATPDTVAKLFPKHLSIGKKFGIVVVTEFENPVEIATFRKDLSYKDGRRPTGIKLATLEEDIERRDFTINGLLFDPIENQLFDHTQGVRDIKKGIVRTIGAPEKRFKEDHLRMLRAIRFSVQLGFKIEKKTWIAIQKHSKKIKKISKERVRDELLKILTSPSPDIGLRLLSDSGILKAILPVIEKLKGVGQSKKYHPEGDVFTHTCLTMKHLKSKEPAVVFAALLHDVDKKSCKFTDSRGTHFYGHELKGVKTAAKIMKEFKFSNESIKKASYIIKNHLKWFNAPEMRVTRLQHLMSDPYFPLALELLWADIKGSSNDLTPYRYIKTQQKKLESLANKPKPLLTGQDLIKLGIKQGPIIGKILAEIEEKRLDEQLKTPQNARKWVKKTHIRDI